MLKGSAPVLLAVIFTGACASGTSPQNPPLIQPGAPGQPSREIDPAQAADLSRVRHTPADVKFMQGMIHHHSQAIDMVELLKTRTTDDGMRKLALRIEVSQADEIQMMREWLQGRGAEVPGAHAHHAPDAPMMPGMLTPAEMEKLAAANGREFDRLFLQYMIKHHDGALVMVRELFDTPGAGQEAEIFAFASDVDADQRMEIARMSAMLKERMQ
jgi:uncharacterized protein (DUF305 family)